MSIYAFKNGFTPIDEANMNPLLSLQPFQIWYQGGLREDRTGNGVVANDLSQYSYCTSFTSIASDFVRIELHLAKIGRGSDVIVQLRRDMNPSAGTDGTLVDERVIPTEHILGTASYISVPLYVTGSSLTNNGWIVLKKGGDATNKINWLGESATISTIKAYRRTNNSGVWTATPPPHFKIYTHSYSQMGLPVHVVEGGTSVTTMYYQSDGRPNRICQYIPPMDGATGGIRQNLQIKYTNDMPIGGE